MIKQITALSFLGALTTIYPQHASAGFGRGFNGGNRQTPPGLTTACGANTNVQLQSELSTSEITTFLSFGFLSLFSAISAFSIFLAS